MKKLIIILSFISLTAAAKINGQSYVSFYHFYTDLMPYGEWIELENEIVVWRPSRIAVNWHPYTIGRWEYTRYGWYWVSYEPFGWATFHYGRWFRHEYYGWLWLPGYEWSPAWVEWRYNSHYIGWAPLPPVLTHSRFHRIKYRTNYDSWRFVNYGNFREPSRYYIPVSRNRETYRGTRVTSNYEKYKGRKINRGVSREIVESYSGKAVKQRELNIITDKNEMKKMRSDGRDDISTFILKENSKRDKNISRKKTDHSYKTKDKNRHERDVNESRIKSPAKRGEIKKGRTRPESIMSKDAKRANNEREKVKRERSGVSRKTLNEPAKRIRK